MATTSRRSRGYARRPLWIIQRYRNNRMDVFTIDPHGDGGFLAVFSFEEEAFLSLSGDDRKSSSGWQGRETSPGELVSVLLEPCAGVRRVALDSLPSSSSYGEVFLPLVSVNRRRFVGDLMGHFGDSVGGLASA
jgi:hypothetical protein